MAYYDLLCNPIYFRRLLNHYNSHYKGPVVQNVVYDKEPLYRDLIKRYYQIDGGKGDEDLNDNIANLNFDKNHIKCLVEDDHHIYQIYNCLGSEFGMARRSARLVEFELFETSIKDHLAILSSLNIYRMDSIVNNSDLDILLSQLRLLFTELQVVPPGSPKLVAVSKTLHFLLPNLVMPIDRDSVLKFLYRKGDVPTKEDKQFRVFTDVFTKYRSITQKLGLKIDNGDGSWWNVSVPKRIDNAILGFWRIFNRNNIESIVCNHFDMLLDYLRIP